jgi:tetratricopeptide (TPR) repeat protein
MIGGKWKVRVLCASVAVLLGAAGSLHAQQDTIVMKDGKERSAKIISEDFDGLRFSVDGGSTSIQWKQIDSIRYSNAGKYDKAIQTFSLGKMSDAVAQLEQLAADTKMRAVLRHGTLYYLGLAYQRVGQTDKAITTYEELLKTFPKTRYILSVGNNLLAAYVKKGDLSGASRALEQSLSGAQSGGADPGLSAGFDLLRARILEEQKKYSEAQTIYERTSTASGADPEVIVSAKLGVARCADRAGQKSEAERRYRELVAQDAPNEVLASVWNGLGDIALEQGTTKRDSDMLRDALFAYLRGVVLYVPGRDGLSDEYERALAGATRAFRAIGELETDADRKKLFLDRARSLKEQLTSGFPESRFLKGL